MDVRATSFDAQVGGLSQKVAASGTSAQSSAITSGSVVVTSDTACWFRCAANPTALADGTDQYLPANLPVRIAGIPSGYKLAFILASGTGNVYISPGA